MSYNNIIMIFEIEKINFEEFKNDLIYKEGILKFPRLHSVIKFVMGYMIWVPKDPILAIDQVKRI